MNEISKNYKEQFFVFITHLNLLKLFFISNSNSKYLTFSAKKFAHLPLPHLPSNPIDLGFKYFLGVNENTVNMLILV